MNAFGSRPRNRQGLHYTHSRRLWPVLPDDIRIALEAVVTLTLSVGLEIVRLQPLAGASKELQAEYLEMVFDEDSPLVWHILERPCGDVIVVGTAVRIHEERNSVK